MRPTDATEVAMAHGLSGCVGSPRDISGSNANNAERETSLPSVVGEMKRLWKLRLNF